MPLVTFLQTKGSTDRHAELLQAIGEQTDPLLVRTRKGATNKETGKSEDYRYVAYPDFIKQLNKLFRFCWDFEVVEFVVRELDVASLGKLTLFPDGRENSPVIRMQWGGMSSYGKIPLGDCLKGSASDALKKCCTSAGIFLDVYENDPSDFVGIDDMSIRRIGVLAQQLYGDQAHERLTKIYHAVSGGRTDLAEGLSASEANEIIRNLTKKINA